MNRALKLSLSLILCVLAAAFCCACTTTGGGLAPSVVGSVTASDPGSPPNLIVRYDGDTLLIVARGAVSAEVFQKATATMPNGLPLFGPIEASAGKTLIHSRSRDLKIELDADAPLPAWLLTSGLFRPGEVAGLGLSFIDESVAP